MSNFLDTIEQSRNRLVHQGIGAVGRIMLRRSDGLIVGAKYVWVTSVNLNTGSSHESLRTEPPVNSYGKRTSHGDLGGYSFGGSSHGGDSHGIVTLVSLHGLVATVRREKL